MDVRYTHSILDLAMRLLLDAVAGAAIGVPAGFT